MQIPGVPSLVFYRRMVSIVFRASRRAKKGLLDFPAWCQCSRDLREALEFVGVQIDVSGIEQVENLNTPCVFIGNHMSTLETFVLPSILVPIMRVNFVVKKSLMKYPVFRHIMCSRDPITVGRENPREDLKAVLEGGVERLDAGVSIIIFPQTTRTPDFDPKAFNSLGVRLAKRAGVPIIPIALKTDAWGTGRILKDFGGIDPSKKVHFAFGEPLRIEGRGDEEHKKVMAFIQGRLEEWKDGDESSGRNSDRHRGVP